MKLISRAQSDISRGPSCAKSGCEQWQQGSSPLLDHLVGAGEQHRRKSTPGTLTT
jgi:hypothetical protein